MTQCSWNFIFFFYFCNKNESDGRWKVNILWEWSHPEIGPEMIPSPNLIPKFQNILESIQNSENKEEYLHY